MAGEVTAHPRGSDKNRWMVYVPAVLMPDGTRTQSERKVVTAGSKNEALRWGQERRAVLIEEHRLRRTGELVAAEPKAPTVAEFTKVWLERLRTKAAKGDRKRSSIEAIESTLRIHVLPFIGEKRLDEITDSVIDALEARWVRGGYQYPGPWGRPVAVKPLASLATRNNRMSPLNAILKLAVERKRIRFMPCTIKIPSVECDEAAYYPPDVYERLVEAASRLGLSLVLMVLLGGDAGMRRGEIIGVDHADVDVQNAEIVVRRSVYIHGGVRYESTPKGRKIKRVPITPRLVDALREAGKQKRGDRVLLTAAGAEVTPKILKRWMMRVEKAAELEPTGRLHILRHSYVSHLAAANVPLISIAGLARHSDLRVTQRYMHLAPGALRQGVDMLVRARERDVAAVMADARGAEGAVDADGHG